MDDYAFATVDEYRIDTGDTATDEERVAAELSRQSATARPRRSTSAGPAPGQGTRRRWRGTS